MIKKFFNQQGHNMELADYITLGIIVLFYTILSFINLGSTKNPQTFYTFSKNESVTLELQDVTDIIKMKLYNGEISGKYYLYASTDNKTYTYIKDINGNGSFSWNDERILIKAKYIKLTAKTEESNIGNISFYNNNKESINIVKSKSSVVNKDTKTIYLTDELKETPSKINFMNTTYFDEIYFARTAYEYANNKQAYEWVHPPLGKLIQAIPIKVFNKMAPFYYRLMGNIAGILMIIVMYIFSKNMFKKRKYAILGALLMTFDTFHFAQTRMGTVDSFLVLFIILSYLYMYKYMMNNNYKNLLLSGIFIGCSIAVKWTGLYAGLGLCIIFLTHVIQKHLINLKLILKSILFFIIIPIVIYISSYLVYPNIQVNYTNTIPNIVTQTKDMYNYHSTLTEEHPFSSKWYTWPISYKPVWYYVNQMDNNKKETITGIGNITIWWMGILSLIYIIINLWKRQDKNSYIILVSILSMWLPYLFIGRVMFLYHYFPVLPFVMLSIVSLIKDITEKFKTDFFLISYSILFIFIFIIYYPVVSGLAIDSNYIDSLKLFSNWIF